MRFTVGFVDLSIGLSRAGSSWELPIFLVVFLSPVILAVPVKWKWL
jgi:hypothetical protein